MNILFFGSLLLYFAVHPDEGYRDLAQSVERAVHGNTSRFLHITLAAGKDWDEIRAIEKHIRSTVAFPFTLQVEGLDLYHIWKPVTHVRAL